MTVWPITIRVMMNPSPNHSGQLAFISMTAPITMAIAGLSLIVPARDVRGRRALARCATADAIISRPANPATVRTPIAGNVPINTDRPVIISGAIPRGIIPSVMAAARFPINGHGPEVREIAVGGSISR